MCVCVFVCQGWITLERGSAGFRCLAYSVSERCGLPGCRCTSNTPTQAFLTNKRWLVCLSSAQLQINVFNTVQILAFSLVGRSATEQTAVLEDCNSSVCVCGCILSQLPCTASGVFCWKRIFCATLCVSVCACLFFFLFCFVFLIIILKHK